VNSRNITLSIQLCNIARNSRAYGKVEGRTSTRNYREIKVSSRIVTPQTPSLKVLWEATSASNLATPFNSAFASLQLLLREPLNAIVRQGLLFLIYKVLPMRYPNSAFKIFQLACAIQKIAITICWFYPPKLIISP